MRISSWPRSDRHIATLTCPSRRGTSRPIAVVAGRTTCQPPSDVQGTRTRSAARCGQARCRVSSGEHHALAETEKPVLRWMAYSHRRGGASYTQSTNCDCHVRWRRQRAMHEKESDRLGRRTHPLDIRVRSARTGEHCDTFSGASCLAEGESQQAGSISYLAS